MSQSKRSMSEYPSCWVACWPTRNPFSKERHLQLLMGFLFNANSLSASPGMFPFVPFQGRSAAGLLSQGGSSLLLVPCRGVSGQCALPPLFSSASHIYLLGCFTLLSRSHLTPGRGLCFVSGCPTGTEDGHNSSKAPAAALTSSPALSTRQPLGVLPKYGEWHPRQNCFSRLSSQSHFISGNWDLFGEVLFFPQDYSNFVLNVSLSSCLCS